MSIARLHVPLRKPEDVKPHLGKPEHYVEDRSGWCIANAWYAAAEGLPELVRLTLETVPALTDAELVEGFLEREVDLGDDGKPSQTDLLALLGFGDRLAIMAVEGKVDEPFGKFIRQELAGASERKRARIERLCAMFDLNPSLVGELRYQLLHRTASAVLEARRYRSTLAIMMVHSFDAADTGASDYYAFAQALGFDDAVTTWTRGPRQVGDVELYLGWTADRPSNEGFTIADRRKTDAGLFDDA